MRVLQAYEYALAPTAAKERACRSHIGARRFAFNWGLALVKERLSAEQCGGAIVPYTLPALRREWNRAKHSIAPWWRENSKEAYSSGLDGLARALQNHRDSKMGKRRGRPAGFPRFRKKLGGRQSVRLRWRDTYRRLGRTSIRVVHIRHDAMHKLTTALARTYGTVVVEELNINGMIRNRRLAQSIMDAGLSGLRRQLSYKCRWYGSELIEAHTFFPSTKTCSRCGAVKATLPLSARIFRCENCGVVVDRDLNAATNLAALAAAVAGSGPETPNARGRDVRPGMAGQTRMKREAGSGSSRQTGASPPQGGGA